jgi:hypothetical protein
MHRADAAHELAPRAAVNRPSARHRLGVPQADVPQEPTEEALRLWQIAGSEQPEVRPLGASGGQNLKGYGYF